MADEQTQTPRHRDCGTMHVHRRLLDSDPGYARRMARIEEHAFRARSGFMAMRPGCTLIPVVVHVVYRTEAENVSQAQIDSQIEVLNRDFRKANPDVSNVPAAFAPLAGDARIQFELARTDPDGNPHSGVIRVETSKNGFGSDDEVKFSSSGGSDAWPRDEYLNLWVCRLSGGLLGYAQFPGGPAETDGVVVTHTGFGTTGSAAAPFDKGRTTTHEIGHWLNLRHIWGDDGEGCSGSDFVDDTPNQGGPNVGKPTFPSVSCDNGPNGDMFMNYMDYVDDDTMVMFSEGQITRMQACLDGPRSAIGSAVSCTGTPVPKVPVKDPPKEFSKEGVKDPIFDPKPVKELPKDPITDPGPKHFKEFSKDPFSDPWPKSIFEPPLPKSVLEPPFGSPAVPAGPQPPPAQPLPSGPPPQPAVQPFVLATGAPGDQSGAAPGGSQGLLGHYAQILGQYVGLYRRGMLDAQGVAAWEQAYAAYRQLGGQ